MADAQKPKADRNITRVKLAMIAALGVVFALVVYAQYFAGDETVTADMTQQDSSARTLKSTQAKTEISSGLTQLTASSDGKAVVAANKAAEAWKPVPLEVALRYDPFATPRQFPQTIAQSRGSTGPMTKEELEATTRAALETSSEDARKALEALQRRGVRAVIAWQDRYYALVDEELIEVGDEIEGFKIVRISADGVDVAKELQQ